jgi:hypothetical protein
MRSLFLRLLQFFASPPPPVRDISMTVGATVLDTGITWAYPAGGNALYRIPIYKLTVEGVKNSGAASTAEFQVFRFGVKQDVGQSPKVVGLADQQTHIIEMWLPEYKVHSQVSAEIGAWKVYDSFLVHDGPDNPQSTTKPFATVGCIELCGPAQFDALNAFIISLSGLTSGTTADKLNAIGNSGKLVITYVEATRPPLISV